MSSNQIKPHVVIGTIGHINHSKTELTEAISKWLSENGYGETYEVPRTNVNGITINPRVAEKTEQAPKTKKIGTKKEIKE